MTSSPSDKPSIFLTFDYEMFLGNTSGGISDCLLLPTEKILDILVKHKVPATFYVDFAFLVSLKNENSLNQIINQLSELIKKGSAVQLHLHPHWFDDTELNQKKARFYVDQYSTKEIKGFVEKCIAFSRQKLWQEFTSYRAGSLNNSTLRRLEPMLYELGFRSDSSVFDSDSKRFRYLKQFKVSTTYYLPISYWKLVYERYFGRDVVRRFGQGNSRPMCFQQKLKRLLFGSRDHLSFDSNKWRVTVAKEINDKNRTVILSHPKSMNVLSLYAMDQFIEKYKPIASFKPIE